MPVCFNYGRETPVKLYGGPEIHACHRVSQHYSCQSEVVVVVVVIMTIITIITILLALHRTRFTATFNLFCQGDLARNHQAYRFFKLPPPQSPRGFSALARPTKTAMLRRLPSAMLELMQVSTRGVSIQISISLGKTFLRISRIRNIPLT